MPTVADLLLVEVQINTGASAPAVDAVSKSVQGIAGATGAATPSLRQLEAAFLSTGVSAQRAQTAAQQLQAAMGRDTEIKKLSAAVQEVGVSSRLAGQQATRLVDEHTRATQGSTALSSAFNLQGQSALRLVGALVGVNIGLSAFSAVGREVHAVINDVIDTSTRFGRTMAEVRAVSGASAEQLGRLGTLALSGGVDIGIGANEAAKGLAELVKGGVSVDAALGGAFRATELMAKAGGVDLAQAAEISAVALNSFGLSAAQLPHVADLVAAAANASSIDVNDFRQSLTQAGAVARTVGVTFEDTSVAIAELGQAGVKGSDAGTSLRTFLLRLTPESKEAESAMRSLGIITADGANKFFDASGRAKGLADVSEVLRTSLAGYTDQQKLATLQVIFGSDAIRAASIFAREGAAGFGELQAAMAKIGADEVARKRLDSLGGDMDVLAAKAERLKIALGSSIELRGVAGGATGVVENAVRLIEQRRLAANAQPFAEAQVAAELRAQFETAPGFAVTRLLEGNDVDAFIAKSRSLISALAAVRIEEQGAAAFLPTIGGGQSSDVSVRAELEANRRSFEATGAATAAAADQTNALLKPARDLRAELDLLAASSKGAAQGVNTLEAATAGLKLAGPQTLQAIAQLRAETALRLREQATGEGLVAGEFRAKLVTETTDAGATPEARARAQERLVFFDREVEAQLKLAQIEQQRASADAAVKREQDLQRQASIAFEISQLPLQDKALQNKIAGLQLDQQAAPIRSAILAIEQQISQVTDQRLSLERELAILKERQRSAPERVGLEENQTRIRELQLELQTRDPTIDRGTTRREIRQLQRAQPGLELDVLRSDQTIRAIERQQAATKLADDIHTNSLNQQRVALQGQLTPLEQRKRLIDDAAGAIQRQLELEKAEFEEGQGGSRKRSLRAQQIAGALGLSADAQQEVIAKLGLPAPVQGPPIPNAAGPNGQPISVTIQNMGDTYVRSDADLEKIKADQQQVLLDVMATVLDKAATNATPPADTNLNGARRPLGQPPNSGKPQ